MEIWRMASMWGRKKLDIPIDFAFLDFLIDSSANHAFCNSAKSSAP